MIFFISFLVLILVLYIFIYPKGDPVEDKFKKARDARIVRGLNAKRKFVRMSHRN